MICFLILGGIALFLRIFWSDMLTFNFASPYPPLAIIGTPFGYPPTVLVWFIKQLMYTSLILGAFNLIPIPPLDGSWILSGILPPGARDFLNQTRRFSFVILLLLALTPIVRYYLDIPIIAGWTVLQAVISVVGLG